MYQRCNRCSQNSNPRDASRPQQFRAGGGGGDGDKDLVNWHCFFNAVSCFRRRRSDPRLTGTAPVRPIYDGVIIDEDVIDGDSSVRDDVSDISGSVRGVSGSGSGVGGSVRGGGQSGDSVGTAGSAGWLRIWVTRRQPL